MSLLNSASSWTSKERRNKRQSTMKKPSLTQQEQAETNETNLMLEGFKTNIPSSIERTQTKQNQRKERINNLINNMNDDDENNDGNHLENFNPLPNPNIHVRKDLPSIQMNNLDYNPNIHEQFSNYTNSYNGEISYKREVPQQNNNGPKINNFGNNDKLLEKINYMIHLLEQQQHEKTDNVAEEFILYSFLGVFIIYVVDGFSRSGKYIR